MSKLTLSTEGNSIERKLPKEGLAQAICIGIVDNGTVETRDFGAKRKVELVFELPHIKDTFNEEVGPEPMRIVGKFNLTLHPKSGMYKAASALLQQSILPASVELTDMLGNNCMIDIKHTEKTAEGKQYANIAAYSRLMDGLTPVVSETKQFTFFWDDFSMEDWNQLPEWKQEKLRETPEWKACEQFKSDVMPTVGNPIIDDTTEEMPF